MNTFRFLIDLWAKDTGWAQMSARQRFFAALFATSFVSLIFTATTWLMPASAVLTIVSARILAREGNGE